jgi:hypothetical protein
VPRFLNRAPTFDSVCGSVRIERANNNVIIKTRVWFKEMGLRVDMSTRNTHTLGRTDLCMYVYG